MFSIFDQSFFNSLIRKGFRDGALFYLTYFNISTIDTALYCRIFTESIRQKQIKLCIMKNDKTMTVEKLRIELKEQLSECKHSNDGSLAAKVNENIQWAWDNWENENLNAHYEGDKPESYTASFRDEWIEDESFDTEIEQINDSPSTER